MELNKLSNRYLNATGVWEIPDDIDTSNFDFTWKPDVHDPPYIHQFGTQWQKTGGPRYVVTGATQLKFQTCQRVIKLEKPNNRRWRNKSNTIFDYSWHPDDTEPPYIYQFGTQWKNEAGAQTNKIGGPRYAVPGATDVKYIGYPRAVCKPLDIVFVSNGETGENDRYEQLCKHASRTVKWVRGVSGRENALRRAAEISDSEWVIVFPGKLRAASDFCFDFHPDPFIDHKHYIFYATNPVNGLVYGHMAAVAYNVRLVLETHEYGLDFTMSKAHDVVSVVSGVAEFNLDPLMTWRTAFREAIKLKVSADDGDYDSELRLNTWLTVGNGLNGHYSTAGAKHGVEFYESVYGNPTELQKSFSWEWLDTYFRRLPPIDNPDK